MNAVAESMQKKISYLYAWDFKNNLAHFLGMDREHLHRSSFLDQRMLAPGKEILTQDLGTVLSASTGSPGPTPVFIFHTAFCCSTLLARSLDIPGSTLVFREPLTLLQLADLKRGFSQTPYEYQAILEKTISLLANISVAQEKVVIKATNLANNLIQDVISIYPDTKILILHDDLDPFLISVLKRPDESVNGIKLFLKRFSVDSSFNPTFLESQITGNLHYQAALAWALQKKQLDTMMNQYADRIRTVHTPDFLESPEKVLPAISHWLDLGLSADNFQHISSSALWSKNAKHPGRHYDVTLRIREQAEMKSRFGDLIDAASRWLEDCIGQIPEHFPENLALSQAHKR